MNESDKDLAERNILCHLTTSRFGVGIGIDIGIDIFFFRDLIPTPLTSTGI
jgi:hypothetical protein